MRAVEVGFDVVGFDLDEDRIKRLAAGDSHVEDVSEPRRRDALATGRYEPTDDPDEPGDSTSPSSTSPRP